MQVAATREQPGETGGLALEGNVLIVTSGATILQRDVMGKESSVGHCAVIVAEWDGTAWHQTFRKLYGASCSGASLRDGRGLVLDGTGQAILLERNDAGAWGDTVISVNQGFGPILQDEDRLVHAKSLGVGERAVAVRRKSAGWKVVQEIPADSWWPTLEANQGLLRVGDAAYQWSADAYVPYAEPSLTFPWESRAVGDCTDKNAASGVCAEEDAGVGNTSGAVRLYGAAANDHPEGLYIKPPRPEASFLFCTPSLVGNVLAVSQIGKFNGQEFVGGTLSLYGRDDSGWHFWYELAAPSSDPPWALSSERLAFSDGGKVTLYRFAPAPEPTYRAPDPPCERDGALLPAGTTCLTETEPVPICAAAGYNSCSYGGTNEFVKRFARRTCSGSDAACDDPWAEEGELATGVRCIQDWDLWCSCSYLCGVDVCYDLVGC